MVPNTSWNAAKQADILNAMITAPGATRHELQGESEREDPRLPLQRDRDRIVWSKSFKRLAHKTQVFPHLYSDHQRDRLTHSLEVMQLSTSIARTLGLNPILCEAIAFAHDLGHTPFGHVGEAALDKALQEIKIEGLAKNVRGLARFSHYEQGVDVVEYIDSTDTSAAGKGLRLHTCVKEGILKHTYDHAGDRSKPKSLAFLLEHTKYDDLKKPGPGTLEGQVVRLCDKLTYFVSDLEDGLAIQAIHVDQLGHWKDDLFKEVFSTLAGKQDGDWRAFRAARDKILTKLVKSVLERGVEGPAGELQVDLGEPVREQFRAVYEQVQKKMFAENILLQKACQRAHHMVSCILCQYLRHPELIPWRFRRKYLTPGTEYRQALERLYSPGEPLEREVECKLGGWQRVRYKEEDLGCVERRQKATRTVADVICVKDYVAGMTDNYAEYRYEGDVDCPESKTYWQDAGMDEVSFCDTKIVV